MSFYINKILNYFNLTTFKKELWIDDDSEELKREPVLLRENILENEEENELNIESELPVIEVPSGLQTTEDVNSDKEVYGNEDKTNALEDVIQLSEKPPTDSEESAIQDGRELEIEINNEMLTIKVDSDYEQNIVEDDETTPNIRILDLECLKDDDDKSIPPWMLWRNPEDTNHCEDAVTGERSDTSKVDDNSSLEIDEKEKSSDSLNDINFKASISSEESQSASPCIQPKFPSSRKLPPIVPTFQGRRSYISNFATKTIKVHQNKSKKRNKSFIANGKRMDNKEDWIPEKKEKILPNLISTYPGGKQRVPFINKF